jgi:hypothetical protein
MTQPPTDDEDDEFTELRNADVPRVDAVKGPANGTPWFFAKQDARAGLVPPEMVRELIGKSEPSDTGQVTMSGSPAAVADLMARIHGAPVRKASGDPYVEFVKAKYNAEDRKRMASSGAAMSDGSYPIEDREDLEHAIHAVGRGSGNSHDAIRRHIIARAKSLGASSEIPDTWNSDGSLKESTVAKADSTPELDPTVVLAEPEDEAPGDPDQPGSPAWEAIDAATARKWTAILSRAKNALCAMADRELMESMVADPDDAGAAFDLQDAECAIDYAISVLAAFAVGEQSESDLAAEAMDALFKSVGALDTAALDTVEALAPIRKAGRVLSAANEAALRDAAAGIQRVLASLPEPTTAAEPVAKQEDSMSETDTATQALAAPITKDDAKPAQVAVYDRNGNLAGVCDPADITPIADAPADDSPDDGQSAEAMIPGTQTVQSPPAGADDTDVMKASIEAGLAPLTEVVTAIAKQVAEQAGLADVVKGLQEQVTALASMPDDRRSPLLNGGTGTPGAAPRTAPTDERVVALEKAVAEASTDAAREQARRDLFFAKTAARFPAPPVRR